MVLCNGNLHVRRVRVRVLIATVKHNTTVGNVECLKVKYRKLGKIRKFLKFDDVILRIDGR